MADNLPLRDGFRRSERGEVSPGFLDIAPFRAPTIDRGRIRARTEEIIGAGRGFRRRRAQTELGRARHSRNPAVARLAIRDILAGQAEGEAQVRGQASTQARQEFAPEFAAQVMGAQAEFQERLRRERFAEELRLLEEERRFEEEEAAAKPLPHLGVSRLPFGGRTGFPETAPQGRPGQFGLPAPPTVPSTSRFEARGDRFASTAITRAQTASRELAALRRPSSAPSI